MKQETIARLSEVFCKVFHAQKWDHDCENGSDKNRIAWQNCVRRLIEEYEKTTCADNKKEL
jgi:hypothetical protein